MKVETDLLLRLENRITKIESKHNFLISEITDFIERKYKGLEDKINEVNKATGIVYKNIHERVAKLEEIENQDLYAKVEDRVRNLEEQYLEIRKGLNNKTYDPVDYKPADYFPTEKICQEKEFDPFSCKCKKPEITDTERLDFIENNKIKTFFLSPCHFTGNKILSVVSSHECNLSNITICETGDNIRESIDSAINKIKLQIKCEDISNE